MAAPTFEVPTHMLITPTSSSHPDTHFRPDIEGLRGVAVLLVVLFHAGLVALPGGFVGVDVFFVISGFLITGLLLREHEKTGRVDLPAFYARRIRRLAPAACLVLAAMIPAVYVLLDPLSRADALLDGAAAALSLSNVRFAAAASDYFAPAGAPSPFLHFWSLSVEEQFYLAWPALIIVSLAIGGRLRLRRMAAAIAIGVVFIWSFTASLALTETSPASAFYMLPTRAWELAAGGLLACLPMAVMRGRAGVLGDLVGWLGLAAIVASAIVLDGSVPYPGVAALLPTAGAAALIATGSRGTGPARVLALPPIRFVGRISYALYLWHWPLLILGAIAVGPLTPTGSAGLVGLAVLLATASTFLVEEPIRRGFTAPTRRTLSLGFTSILVLALGGTSLSVVSAAELDRVDGTATTVPTDEELWIDDELVVEQSAEPVVTTPEPDPATPEPSRSEAPVGPTASAGPTAAPMPSRTPKPQSTTKPMPELVAAQDMTYLFVTARKRGPSESTDSYSPSLGDVREDEERLKADRCIAYEPETKPRTCDYGSGSFTVALVGDSHASHWFPALNAVAKRRNWTVVPMIKVACPFLDMAVHSNALKREYRECEAFNDAVVTRLGKLKPDITIVSLNHWVLPHRESDGTVAKIGAALGRQLNQVPGRVLLLADSPHSGADVPTCLAENRGNHDACVTPYWKAFSDHAVIEKVGAKAAGVPLIDLGPAICSEDPCPDVVDGLVVYRDSHHLTATFSRSLAPALDRVIRLALQ